MLNKRVLVLVIIDRSHLQTLFEAHARVLLAAKFYKFLALVLNKRLRQTMADLVQEYS